MCVVRVCDVCVFAVCVMCVCVCCVCVVCVCSPNVLFCGYSIPHPSESLMHIRVQTAVDENQQPLVTPDAAVRDGVHSLLGLCSHVLDEFDSKCDKLEKRSKRGD